MTARGARALAVAAGVLFAVQVSRPAFAADGDDPTPVNAPSAASAPVSAGAPAEPGAEPAARPSARGERGVLESARRGSRLVTGRVGKPERLDRSGYIADLRIEQAFPGSGLRAGSTIRFVWEELSPSRAVRFARDDRVLVSLTSLPTTSIWRKRLPTPAQRSGVLLLESRGDAFVRNPSQASAYALEHYLLMAPRERERAAGLAYIVDLVAVAAPGLANEALATLAACEDLATRLADGSQIALVRIAADQRLSFELRVRVLDLAGQRRLEAARPELERLASGPPPIDAAALGALARIDGALSAEETKQMLSSERQELRLVGVRFADSSDGELLLEQLTPLIESDPSAAVRRAIVERLLDALGAQAYEAALRGLGDEDDAARTEIATRIGREGAVIVPLLKLRIYDENDAYTRNESDGAVIALGFAGMDGTQLLKQVHEEHPDERTRKLAGLALGHFPGHEH